PIPERFMPLQTRRDFFRTAAGLGAAAVLTRFTHAAAPSERVRIGCIGVKNQGTSNLKNFFKQPYAQVVAVCDVDKTVLGTAAKFVEKETKAAPDTYSDFRRLLDRKDIDAVCVTTPDHWHALPTIQACMAGKRSEERRVGKECRSRGAPEHEKKKQK